MTSESPEFYAISANRILGWIEPIIRQQEGLSPDATIAFTWDWNQNDEPVLLYQILHQRS